VISGARRTFLTLPKDPDSQLAFQNTSDVGRVLRARCNQAGVFVRCETTADGVTTSRLDAVPLWGIAIPVPGGSTVVRLITANAGEVEATLSPGAPVVERVWDQWKGTVSLQPPLFSRGVWITLLTGSILVDGIPLSVVGMRLPFKAKILPIVDVAPAGQSEFAVEWEIES
jgi:hypothetical protein